MLWITNLNHGASEVGAAVGPQAGQGLMLMLIGRCWWLACAAGEAMRLLGMG